MISQKSERRNADHPIACFVATGHFPSLRQACWTAALFGSMVLAIQFGKKNSTDDVVHAKPSSVTTPVSLKQDAQDARHAERDEDFSEFEDNRQFCQVDSHGLARTRFALDDQLKLSIAARLAKRYRIETKHADEIVRTTAKVSKDRDVDPFLVLGIIAKESSFNKNAKSGYGAAGLMQVHAPSHKALLKTLGLNTGNLKAMEKSLLSEIRLNVAAGVQIYKQYEKQYESRAKALQAYNGAKNDATYKYAKSVFGLRDAFSAEAAASIDCQNAEYALMNREMQRLDVLRQKPNPA